jgi:GT2 family glycosyltransferase
MIHKTIEVSLQVLQLGKSEDEFEVLSTLIICTYNRPKTLFENLKILVEMQDLPKEIIIVDGSTNMDTLFLVKSFLAKINFSSNLYYVLSPPGLTLQRNAGISISNGKYLHFLDDDCYPEENYFKKIEELFINQPELGAVTGNIVNEFLLKPGLKYELRCKFGIYKRFYKTGIYYCNGSSVPKGVSGPIFKDEEVDIVSGASMSFDKVILEKAGNFSLFFSGYSQGEDLEVSLRVRRIAKIILSFEARCNHIQEPSSRPDLFKKGTMEVYNKYYIWDININPKFLSCRIQFWGDVLFLHVYTILLFFKSGFKLNYIYYFIGLLNGALLSLMKKKIGNNGNTYLYKINVQNSII